MNRAALCARAAAATIVAAAATSCAPGASAAGIATTKHNLSVSGPGTVKAAAETEICIFCHAPHNASPAAALWNRRLPGSTYTPYTSSTTRSSPGQPNGSSLLCLSCHDGTIALGEVLTRGAPIPMAGGVTTMPAGAGRLGTDLSDDHPVSIAYTAALASARGELVNPATLTGKVRLDAGGQLQCRACHDPHDDTNGKFLVAPNLASALCQTCHVKTDWALSAHRTSGRTWNGAGTNPWPHTSWTTVADNACESCHRPHSAGGRRGLLNYAIEEDNCYPCHNGNVAAKNVQAEFSKPSRHPVTAFTGTHDPVEAAVATTRHAECVDCHNPHAARSGTGVPNGPLAGVRGITIAGAPIDPATAEYEICFRCHADSTNKPPPRTTRQIAQTNTRLEFGTANPSYHPVAGVGRSTNVPSLIPPWTTASTIKCTDCHNNNAGPGAGGTGPRGPHGSTFAPLLERQYAVTDNTSESATNYALCYKCHSRTSILGNQSFRDHSKHIVGERTPCNVCHDPHGISATQGNAVNNSRLINFDTVVVRPSSSGILRFEQTGTNRGRCYLTCHGVNHNPKSY
ncbi:hypothetical protein FBR04_12255 [Betaproteobacteria bacterium PRO7]|nr:hypothetical protein [Betaproteobacteria bacterium PRO7]